MAGKHVSSTSLVLTRTTALVVATLAAVVALAVASRNGPLGDSGSGVTSLGSYNVDIHRTSVSGLSAGAYFAVQMHVAYSSVIVGSGIFAGGPYDCAEGSSTTATTTCMKGVPGPNVNQYVSTTNARAKNGDIDPTSYLTDDKVFMFSGTLDTTVHQSVMNALQQYYEAFINTDQIYYEDSIAAAHTMPTTDPDENPCNVSKTPFISDCNYDGAGKALQQIYGTLNPPNTGAPAGQLIQFDQSEFIPDPTSKSMSSTGWVYVPNTCAQNQSCILHASFHGCEQYYNAVGDAYITNSGFNAWADTNNMIILYPQTIKSYAPLNPYGCYDWWGYNHDPTTYDTKSGVQMKGVFAMINRVASGYVSIVAPTGLKATSVQNHSIALQWSTVLGASGFAVIRNGVQVAHVQLTTYNDTGLNSGTTYTYQVAGIAQSGALGQLSSPISVTTTGVAPPLSVPEGLSVADVTSSSVTLQWDQVPGASGYNVIRNDTVVATNEPHATYEDDNLSAFTTYSYVVAAVDSSSNQGPSSAPLIVTTASSFECKTYTASNYDQVKSGRAYEKYGLCYAVGSNDSMGLYNIFIITTLSETSPDYFSVGQCPSSRNASEALRPLSSSPSVISKMPIN